MKKVALAFVLVVAGLSLGGCFVGKGKAQPRSSPKADPIRLENGQLLGRFRFNNGVSATA